MENIKKPVLFEELRRGFHAALLQAVLVSDSGIPTNADKTSPASVAIARGILNRLGSEVIGARLAGQTSGSKFEEICKNFVDLAFRQLDHLRPGRWGRNRSEIAKYEQYEHLIALELAAKKDRDPAALGSDYTITPDIIVWRETEEDSELNRDKGLIDTNVSGGVRNFVLLRFRPILAAAVCLGT